MNRHIPWVFGCIALACVMFLGGAFAQAATYTTDADFDGGALTAVNHDTPNNDQLQLNGAGEPFEFIWVAASGRGTIIKIDTKTGEILGEYWSAPRRPGQEPLAHHGGRQRQRVGGQPR